MLSASIYIYTHIFICIYTYDADVQNAHVHVCSHMYLHTTTYRVCIKSSHIHKYTDAVEQTSKKSKRQQLQQRRRPDRKRPDRKVPRQFQRLSIKRSLLLTLNQSQLHAHSKVCRTTAVLNEISKRIMLSHSLIFRNTPMHLRRTKKPRYFVC